MVRPKATEPDQAVNRILRGQVSDPARQPRRLEIRQQNETMILQAAEKVFAEAGFGGATMQLIADLAGLPGRARLVGKALGYAPAELAVPWYRVLRSDRSLAFPQGSATAEEQRQHLLAEGVLIKQNRVSKNDIWQPELAELLFNLQY